MMLGTENISSKIYNNLLDSQFVPIHKERKREQYLNTPINNEEYYRAFSNIYVITNHSKLRSF